MLEKKPIKTQAVVMVAVIMAASLVATLATYAAGFLVYREVASGSVYAANYYEKQIPAIERELRKLGAAVLNPSGEPTVRRLVPAKGIHFQVLDAGGRVRYGTAGDRLVSRGIELREVVNTTQGKNGTYVRVMPVFDDVNQLRGAVALSYAVKPTFPYEPDRFWVVPLFLVIVLSPLLYVVLFTWLVSRKLAANIRRPVAMLIKASERVKERDLDFDIAYRADNELGRLSDAFNSMKDALKASLAAQWRTELERQEMVQALAHDLKTPLAAILGYTESLQDDPAADPAKIHAYLQVIHSHAGRGTELLEEMLYAAELESSVDHVNVESIDAKAFMARKKEQYEPAAASRGISLSLETAGGTPAVFRADARMLDRMLDNLFWNSIRFTPGGGTISVRVELTRSCVRFEVRDTGPGFSNEELSNLFRKFYKGDRSRSSAGHGRHGGGLGLYIVKKLAELHGGTAAAANAPGGGASVSFTLPQTP